MLHTWYRNEMTFESWYITSRWRLIQKVLVNMYRVQYLIPAILHYLNFQFPLNKTVALKTVVLKTVVLNIYYCFHSTENMGIKLLHTSIINAYHTYTLKLVAQATRCPGLNSQWLLALSLSHLNIKLTVCTSCWCSDGTELSYSTLTIDCCHLNGVLGGGGQSVKGDPTPSISCPRYCHTVNTTTGGWGVANHIASNITVTFSAIDRIPCYGDIG